MRFPPLDIDLDLARAAGDLDLDLDLDLDRDRDRSFGDLAGDFELISSIIRNIYDL